MERSELAPYYDNQTPNTLEPELIEPAQIKRHARGVGYRNGTVLDRNGVGLPIDGLAIDKACPESAVDWARSLTRRVQIECSRALEYWGQALTDGTVRPDSIPLGIALLLSKRMELQAEIATLTPTSTHTPADTLLAELCAEPGPKTLDSRELPDWPQLPAPHQPPPL